MDLNNTLSFCIKLAVAFLILQFFYCNSNDMHESVEKQAEYVEYH
jgi:CHASE3 domain sensor protein